MKSKILFSPFIVLLTLILSNTASALIKIEPSDDVISDTENFIHAFAKVSQYETIRIEGGEYFINKSMPELLNTVRITSDGIARIHLINVDRFITISGIDSIVENLFITGDNARTSNGILVKNTAHAKLEEINFSGLNVALEFGFAHDFKGLNGLVFFNNDTDFLVEALDSDHSESSSFHFENCVMLHSERAIAINTSVVNFSFNNCILAPWSKVETRPVSFHRPAFQGSFSNTRFEARGFNVPVDNLYINGANFTFPSQAITLENNYFTGVNINIHINLDRFTKNINVTNNLFKKIPHLCDIKLATNSQSNNFALVNDKRELKVCN